MLRDPLSLAVAGWLLIAVAFASAVASGAEAEAKPALGQIVAVVALFGGAGLGTAAFVMALRRLRSGSRGLALWASLGLGLVPMLLIALTLVTAMLGGPSGRP